MKKLLYLLFSVVPVVALMLGVYFGFARVAGARADVTCTPTGYIKDNINLTAATIVSSSNTTVTGTVAAGAAGCNIGVFVNSGLTGVVITNTDIYGL